MGEISNLKKFIKVDNKDKDVRYQKKIPKEENFEKPKRILLTENNIKEEM